MEYEKETFAIIGAAMEVHSQLGKGYLEAVYQEAMILEMTQRGIPFIVQPQLHIIYKGTPLSKFYVPDFVTYGLIPLELKAHAEPICKANLKQIVNSLRVCNSPVGLLANFGRESLDFRRIMNDLSL